MCHLKEVTTFAFKETLPTFSVGFLGVPRGLRHTQLKQGPIFFQKETIYFQPLSQWLPPSLGSWPQLHLGLKAAFFWGEGGEKPSAVSGFLFPLSLLTAQEVSPCILAWEIFPCCFI
jgi:hypothetical protein